MKKPKRNMFHNSPLNIHSSSNHFSFSRLPVRLFHLLERLHRIVSITIRLAILKSKAKGLATVDGVTQRQAFWHRLAQSLYVVTAMGASVNFRTHPVHLDRHKLAVVFWRREPKAPTAFNVLLRARLLVGEVRLSPE